MTWARVCLAYKIRTPSSASPISFPGTGGADVWIPVFTGMVKPEILHSMTRAEEVAWLLCYEMYFRTVAISQPRIAQAGKVTIQVITIFLAISHFTAERRLVAPTPIIAVLAQ